MLTFLPLWFLPEFLSPDIVPACDELDWDWSVPVGLDAVLDPLLLPIDPEPAEPDCAPVLPEPAPVPPEPDPEPPPPCANDGSVNASNNAQSNDSFFIGDLLERIVYVFRMR
jgi:hypothetical protein